MPGQAARADRVAAATQALLATPWGQDLRTSIMNNGAGDEALQINQIMSIAREQAELKTPFVLADPVPDLTQIELRANWQRDLEAVYGPSFLDLTPQMKTAVSTLCDHLSMVPALAADGYATLLLQAAKGTSGLSSFKNDLEPSIDVRSATFGGVNLSDSVQKLAIGSVGAAIGNNADQFGFSALAKLDVANKWRQDGIIALLPLLMIDHLDSSLAGLGVPTISDIAKTNPELKQAFMDHALRPTFVHTLSMYDKQFGTTDYFTHVLAVFEFFRLGPSVQMSKTADPTAEMAADSSTHWTQVVAKTVEIVQTPDFLAAKPNASLDAHARAASSILAVNGTPQAPLDTVAGELKKHILKPTDPWANNSAATNFQSLGQQVWVAWDNKQDSFTKAVRAAITRVRNEQKKSLTDTVGDNPPLEQTTDEAVHGDDIVAFVKANQDLFNGVPDDGKRTVVTGTDIDVARPSSCFRLGTLVLTPTGSTAIEELREGDMVVTLGGEYSQYGRCSDEVVRTSTVPPRGQKALNIWGFNGKPEFFTAGHVFHTTTGLRAIDPQLALVENP